MMAALAEECKCTLSLTFRRWSFADLPERVSNSDGGFGTIWKCGQNWRKTMRPPRNAPTIMARHAQ
jgi:hypothetical protein